MSMLSRVLRTIRRHELFTGPGSNGVLCAVSGGPDSMALMDCLWELAPRLGLTLEVATVDHGLRPEAAREISLVAERSEAMGLPWHRVSVDVAGARANRAGGVQEVARRLRLTALAALAESRGIGRVALGHQADDQTETVLFRILRGTGIAGLAGIPYRRDPFVRPLLDITREDILGYLGRRSVPYVTDPSNANPHYARARLRHEILPRLRRENPRVDEALRSLARAATAGDTDIEGPITGLLAEVTAAGVHIPMRTMTEIAEAVRDGNGTRCFDVARGRKVTVSYGKARLQPRTESGPTDTHPPVAPVRIDGAGAYPWTGGGGILVRDLARDMVRDMDATGRHPEAVVEGGQIDWSWFDGDQLAWPLWVRPRHPGDRMRPRGGAGSRKLSDLMIDAQIPRPERLSTPIVTTSQGEPLFVPGLRPSRLGEPSSLTRRWVGLAAGPLFGHDGLVDPSIFGSNTQDDRFLKHHQGKVDD